MRRHLLMAVVGLGLTLMAPRLHAQAPIRFGPQVSFGNSSDAGLGIRVENRFSPRPDWRFAGSFDVFMPDGPEEYWELNGNVLRSFLVSGSDVAPYVGGGVNLAHSRVDGVPGSTDTNLGLNVMGGMRFATQSRFSPFLEVRAQFGGGEQAVLTTGLLF